MTVLIPYNNPLGESFASMLSNEINGVQFMDDKVWLVISPAGDITSWLVPLLCPVCGGAWHFNAGNIEVNSPRKTSWIHPRGNALSNSGDRAKHPRRSN